MKKHVQIKDSYKVWHPLNMAKRLGAMGILISYKQNIRALITEWWLHNIGYWLTRPFIFIPAVRKLNIRFQHVDLMVEVDNDC